MKNHSRLIAFSSIAVALAGVMADASAVTIGRIRGAPLLGQGLDVAVQLQYAPDEDATGACYAATVQYGDQVQAASRVTVSPQPDAQGRPALLRIQSAVPLFEPTVSVTVAVGCTQKVSRVFHLLAEVAVDAGTSSAAGMPQPLAGDAPPKQAAPVAAVAKPPQAAPVTRKKVEPSAPVAPRAAASAGATPAVKPSAAASADNKLLAAQIAELEKRVDALAQAKAQEPAAEAARSEQQLKSMEADLRNLQALAAKNQQNVQLLVQTLEKTEPAGASNTLVYGLGALLLLAFGGIALLARRSDGSKRSPWWSTASAPATASSTAVAAPVPAPVTAPVAKAAAPVQAAPAAAPQAEAAVGPEVDLDLAIDLAALEQQAQAAVAAPAAAADEVARSDKRDFAHSSATALRAINTKEMLDVRQQAEFFMALGQHAEAIKLLEGSINDNDQANPLVYLDLLTVLHTLGRKQEFDRYAAEFNLQFTGRVPDYQAFNAVGNSLDAYTDICDQIAQLWPSEDAMEYIEHCLVRTPEDEPENGFDLEAFRDLLMLHGMLRRLDVLGDSAMVPFSATRSPSSQLGSLGREQPPAAPAIPAVDNTGPVDAPPTQAADDHEHLDLSEPLPDIHLPDLDAPAVTVAAPAPTTNTPQTVPDAVSPSAYADLGSKADNLIDFDLSGLGNLPKRPGQS